MLETAALLLRHNMEEGTQSERRSGVLDGRVARSSFWVQIFARYHWLRYERLSKDVEAHLVMLSTAGLGTG